MAGASKKFDVSKILGFQGSIGLRILYEVMVSKVSMSKVFKMSPSPRASGFAGSRVNCEVQGFRRSPFMDLVFRGHQRAIRLRVSRDRGFPHVIQGFQRV